MTLNVQDWRRDGIHPARTQSCTQELLSERADYSRPGSSAESEVSSSDQRRLACRLDVHVSYPMEHYFVQCEVFLVPDTFLPCDELGHCVAELQADNQASHSIHATPFLLEELLVRHRFARTIPGIETGHSHWRMCIGSMVRALMPPWPGNPAGGRGRRRDSLGGCAVVHPMQPQ